MTLRFVPACLALLVFTSGCPSPSDQNEGTAVGNPGAVALALGEAASDLEYTDGEALVGGGSVINCADTNTQEVTGFDESTGLDGFASFEIPLGTWCALTLIDVALGVDGVLTTSPGDSDFALWLEIPTLTVHAATAAGFQITEDQELLFELAGPGWLSADLLGLTAGESVVIGAEDLLHNDLTAVIVEESSLFDDPDGDGEVSEDERADSVATGDNPFPEPGETSTPGCAQLGARPSPWMVLGLLLLLPRRRRVARRLLFHGACNASSPHPPSPPSSCSA